MTFSAIDSETQHRYTVEQLSGLGDSKLDVTQRLICPISLKQVRPVRQYLRQGANVRAHFRHMGSDIEWPEDVIFDNEYGALCTIAVPVPVRYIKVIGGNGLRTAIYFGKNR